MKIKMDRAEIGDRPEAMRRTMNRDHQAAKSLVSILAERVDKLGRMLSKMPNLMHKLRDDHKVSLQGVQKHMNDLTMWLDAAKKAETLSSVERRLRTAAALTELEGGLAAGRGAGKEGRWGAGGGLIDEGRTLHVRAEVEADKAEKLKAVSEFKAVAAASNLQEPLLSRHSFRLNLLRKLATIKKALVAITDGQARVHNAKRVLATPTTITTAAPPDPRLAATGSRKWWCTKRCCTTAAVRDLLQTPPTLEEDPTGRELSDWMMKAGDALANLGHFDRATACFKAVETAMTT
jgi:hypothetical protein